MSMVDHDVVLLHGFVFFKGATINTGEELCQTFLSLPEIRSNHLHKLDCLADLKSMILNFFFSVANPKD